MPENLYVVVGASGHVGGGVARALLESKKKVRVIARTAESLNALKALGAEVAVGSIEDEAFLRTALRGATAALVMIPANFALRKGQRKWQNRVAENQARAVEANKVKYVVALSRIGAQTGDGNGPIGGLHDLEQRLNKIVGANLLHLRPGYFYENHLGNIGAIMGMGLMGGALAPDLPMSQIASRDVGQVAGKRLLALDWTGKNVLELHGPKELTMAEAARALGKAIGRPDLKYQQFPYADTVKAMIAASIPEEIAAGFVEMARGFNHGSVVPTQKRSAETTTPTTIEEFASAVFAPACFETVVAG